jgi:phage baseplate assembly protein gpV
MISLPFQQQFTWRKLGYLFYTDSLEYRAVLEENPQWSVTELPPIGAQLRLPSPQSTNGVKQSSFLFNLPQGNEADAIFPFATQAEYEKALSKYTVQGVVLRESVNGYSFDNLSAQTGIQQIG